MRSKFMLVAAAILTQVITSTAVAAAASTDKASILAVLTAYETALNEADTNAIMALYADDGVFMPQHSKPNVGSEAVRMAYEGVFKTIALNIDFTIDETLQVSPDWAIARTQSSGIVTLNATGEQFPEANQELFVLQRQANKEWKIARYVFTTTNLPRK
ncbi:SnoaL-like domain protein [Roseibium album]|nr:SnoaL-like domain protein [Roseibium album]